MSSNSIVSSLSSPIITFKKPVKTISSPLPPASTTPAFFKTGSISGVIFKISSPAAMVAFKNSSISWVFFAILTASSLITLITVKIVPSFGFVTALYATSAPSFKAFANSLELISFSDTRADEKPLRIWERITPELPLAPFKAPLLTASAMSSRLFVVIMLTSLTAERIVIDMLVPVSPSGTGNTFNESTYSLLLSR